MYAWGVTLCHTWIYHDERTYNNKKLRSDSDKVRTYHQITFGNTWLCNQNDVGESDCFHFDVYSPAWLKVDQLIDLDGTWQSHVCSWNHTDCHFPHLPATSPLQRIKKLGLWTTKESEQIYIHEIFGLPIGFFKKTKFRKDLRDRSEMRKSRDSISGTLSLSNQVDQKCR